MKRLWIILVWALACNLFGTTDSASGFQLMGSRGECSSGQCGSGDCGSGDCGIGGRGSGGFFSGWQPMRLPSVLRGRLSGRAQQFTAQHPAMAMAAGRMLPPGMSPYGPYANNGPSPDVWANGGGGYQNLGGTCCGPRWWDFRAEAVFLTRSLGGGIPIMSDGIRGFGPPQTVLASNSAQFNFEPGFRVAGRFQLNAVSSIEAEYLGGLDWDDRKTRFSNSNSLYSAFSDFGNIPLGGFEDSDQASNTSLSYESELDIIEVNSRREWSSNDSRTHGSWLLGVRYARIDESLVHDINVSPHFDPINLINRAAEFTNYNIRVENDLVGLQAGSEVIRCLSPGLTLGGEIKGGVYGNNAELRSTLVSTTLPGGVVENESDAGMAFASSGRLFLLWQIHPLWKLSSGYEVMFFDGVATASGNYNAAPFLNTDPAGNPVVTPIRQVRLDDHENLLFHGFHIGLEFGW